MSQINERMKYPIGPETCKKAAKTEPGKLAILLNRVLYSADNKTIKEKGYHDDIETTRWVAQDQVYAGIKQDFPEGVDHVGHNDDYFMTKSLMLAIRDYLEWQSLREVID